MADERGTTIVELLVTLTLTCMLFVAVMSIWTFATACNDREIKRTDIQYAARQSRESISRDFRSSSEFKIYNSYPVAGSPVNEGVCLELKIEPTGVAAYYIYYYVKSGSDNIPQLYRDESGGTTPNPVASNIERVTFKRVSSRLLDLKVESTQIRSPKTPSVVEGPRYILETNLRRRID